MKYSMAYNYSMQAFVASLPAVVIRMAVLQGVPHKHKEAP